MVRQWVAAVALMVVAWSAHAAEVTVTPDRTTVFENESFNVEFSYDEEIRGRPNFDVLTDDFQIIAQSPSSRLQSINGRFSYELSWTLTLMPRRPGTLSIPAVQFDRTQSRPVTITVKSAPEGDTATELGDLSLEVTFTPDEGYVQGQFIYTQRLYHLGWLAGGKLSPPTFGDSDAVVRQLDQVKRYTLFRDGERYQIYEQTYLVFPQRSGTLQADATAFTGELREPGVPPRLKRVSAPAVAVEVLGVPDGIVSSEFLPATELTLDEIWPDVESLEVGRPYTRVIKMEASGLMSSQLRAIEFPERDDLRIYADQPQRDDVFAQSGVTGTVSQSIAIVPQRAGELTLPSIEVRWWDVDDKVARVATLPQRVVEVVGVAGSSVDQYPQAASTQSATASNAGGASPNPAQSGWRYWPLTTLIFGLLWMATAAAWGVSLRAQRARAPMPTKAILDPRRKRALFATRSELKKACDGGDARVASAALLEWSHAIWPDDPPGGLSDIASRLDDDQALEVTRLAHARYSANSAWTGSDRLWQVLAQLKPRPGRRLESVDEALAQL